MHNIAELLGAIAGDGHIDYKKRYRETTIYKLTFSGNFSEDLDYYKKIRIFVKKSFSKKLNFHRQRENELIANIYSKKLVEHLISLGAIDGNKSKKIEIQICLCISIRHYDRITICRQ